MNMNIESMVIEVISKKLKVNPEKLGPSSKLHDLGLDSLDLAELIFVLEDKVKRNVSFTQEDKIETLNDLVGLVSKQLEQNIKSIGD